MGDMADMLIDDYYALYGDDGDNGYPHPEDYLGMTDDELRKATSGARSEKIKSIRKWPHPLTEKQRYCLAAWLAERDTNYR